MSGSAHPDFAEESHGRPRKEDREASSCTDQCDHCDGWLAAPNAASKLHAVMLEHEAWPSVADNIVAGFNAFLQHTLDAADAPEVYGCFASLNDMKTHTPALF